MLLKSFCIILVKTQTSPLFHDVNFIFNHFFIQVFSFLECVNQPVCVSSYNQKADSLHCKKKKKIPFFFLQETVKIFTYILTSFLRLKKYGKIPGNSIANIFP